MVRLSIRLLGAVDIKLDEKPVTGFVSGKAQALLIYLVVTGRACPRATLATLFWGDYGETSARRSLSKALSNLRQLVGDFLQIDRHSAAFRMSSQHWVDVVHFVQALEGIATHAPSVQTGPVLMGRDQQQAVALYRGEFLSGFQVADAPDFEAWMRRERHRLHRLCCEALIHFIQQTSAANAWTQAIGWTEQLLQLEPADEDAHRQLMMLYSLMGQRNRALVQYTACCEVLARELDVAPAAETVSLFQEIREGRTPVQLGTFGTVSTRPISGDSTIASQPLHRESTVEGIDDQQRLPFVGRQESLQQLKMAWQQSVGAGSHFCLIHGEAGVGKTRLAEVVLAWAGNQGYAIARARAYAAAGELAYTPVIEWLRSAALQPTLHRLEPVWLTELARLLPELTPNRAEATTSAGIAAAGDHQWQRQRLFDALVRAMRAGSGPKILLLDDLQWCDRETLAWLHYLLQRPQAAASHSDNGASLLIVATARPEILDEEHPFQPILRHLRSVERVTEIDLEPLDEVATTALATQLTKHPLTPTQTAQLYQYTEGNPLFVIETLRMGNWQQGLTATATAQPPLPAKVQAVIQERLAALAPSAQRLAGLAAVIGRSFDFGLLQQASDEPEAQLITELDQLWQQGIIHPHGNQRYDFSHDRIREVAYLTVSPVQRPLWHRRVAAALETLYEEDLTPLSLQLAFHFEEAGEWERAIHYYHQAAQQAHAIFADKKAVDLLQKALEMTGLLPNTRQHKKLELSLLLAMGSPLNNIEGFRSTMLDVCTRARLLSKELGALGEQFSVLQDLRTFYQQRAEYEMAHNMAVEMVNLAQHMEKIADKDDGEHAFRNKMVHNMLGNILFFQGQLAASQLSRKRALTYGKPSVGSFVFSAQTLWLLGYPDQAKQSILNAWIEAQGQGDLHRLGFAMTGAARLHHLAGHIPQTRLWAKKIHELYSAAHDLPRWGQMGQLFLAYTHVLQGNIDEGLPLLQATLEKMDEDQHFVNRSHYLTLLAESYTYAKEQTNALAIVNEAIEFCESTGERYWYAELLRLRGDYRLALGASHGEVELAYHEAINIAQEQQAKSLELRATMSLARLWQQQGQHAAALARLSEIYNWFTEGFNTADLRAAKALLEQLKQ